MASGRAAFEDQITLFPIGDFNVLSRFMKTISIVFDNLIENKSPIRSSSTRSTPIAVAASSEPAPKSRDPHIIKFAGRGEDEWKEYSIEEFERLTGHTYLPGLEFENQKTLQRIRNLCAHASRKSYIDTDRKWLGALHATQIRNQYIPDVSIRWINETLGYGLFAEEDIRAWEYVGEYTGVIRRHQRIRKNINDYCFLYPTSVFYFGKYLIDAQEKGNEIRYANHSDEPNCESISVFCEDLFHIILRAIRDIPAQEQITYHYSDLYWKFRPRVPNVNVRNGFGDKQ